MHDATGCITVDVRCDGCGRLLGKVSPTSYVEIKCPRCKQITVFGDGQPRAADKLARPDKVKMATP